MYVDDLPRARNELIVDHFWSPVSHGRIRSLDLSAAREIDGIAGLYTYRDLPGVNLFGPIIADETLLAEDRCLWMGHPIVVIAAESREAIRLAKRAIKADIEELPPTLTIDEAIARGEFIGETRRIIRGDVEAALASSDHILEGIFENQGQDHFYLESQAAIVHPGEHGSLTVHSSTQNPTEVQEVIAKVLGLKFNQVVCITRRMGGAFGGKECQATHPAAMAALVALKTKRPARIAYNKDDDMQVTGKRHPFQIRYKVGFASDGRVIALKADLYSDGGAYADLSPAVMGRAMTHADNAYYLENAAISGTVCRTHTAPNTAFRGFGGPQGVAMIENILEEIALVVKKDAYDVRRLNCYEPLANESAEPRRAVTPYGQIVHHNTLPRLFDELLASSDYRARANAVKEFNARSKTHLKGLALTAVKFGISFNTKFLNQASALVNIYLDGTVQVSTGATEMGQGVNTKIQQLVAGELGIEPGDVAVMITSTEKNNNSSATAASSAADLNGGAAVDACSRLRERLAGCAAKLFASKDSSLPLSMSDVVFAEGSVSDRRKPDVRLTFRHVVKAAWLDRISLGERGFYATPGIDWDAILCTGNPFRYFTMGCAASEVLIDRFTGALEVLRADLLMDIGKPINPGIDRGQITGAFIQGMGWLTTEDLRYAANGELLSHSPTTYKIPNIHDVPKVFNVAWIDAENPWAVRGSKAVGEPPLLLSISVWCAIKHALSFVSNGEIPKLSIPATNEEIVMRLASYVAARAVTSKP